jgi:hypothetical protein
MVISVESRGNIMTKLNKTMSTKDRNEWLSKGSSSINADQTPELFVGT